MSAIGPKRTSLVGPHMSALGGKADMTVCGNPLSRWLLGVKRTSLFATHVSAFDPKRTLTPSHRGLWTVRRACRSKTHYFIVTLASARAAGMFGGGNGAASTSTQMGLGQIGASPAEPLWGGLV